MTIHDMRSLAESMARSKLFGISDPDAMLSLMAISQAHGQHPALAAQDYDIIQGRPSKSAEAMQRDFLAAGGRIEWHRLDDEVADATFSHPTGGTVRIHWDMERAKQAGLAGKDNWRKYPRPQLRARCVSEGTRTVFPGATSGMYVPGEAQDISAPEPRRVSVQTARAPRQPEPEPDVIEGEVAEDDVRPIIDAITIAATIEELDELGSDIAGMEPAVRADPRIRVAFGEKQRQLKKSKPAPAPADTDEDWE